MVEVNRTSGGLIIIGAGGFGREVRDLATDVDHILVGFLDDAPQLEPPLHAPVLGPSDWAGETDVPYVVAVGNPAAKQRLVRIANEAGRVAAAAIVHPSVLQGLGVTLGDGTLVTAGCIITTNVAVGSHVILNLGCTVGHDAVIEDYVSAMPGVHVSGNVLIREGVFLGTNSAILEGVTVGPGATVGAGAVVTRDVEAGTTVVGVPAKPLTRRDS